MNIIYLIFALIIYVIFQIFYIHYLPNDYDDDGLSLAKRHRLYGTHNNQFSSES